MLPKQNSPGEQHEEPPFRYTASPTPSDKGDQDPATDPEPHEEPEEPEDQGECRKRKRRRESTEDALTIQLEHFQRTQQSFLQQSFLLIEKRLVGQFEQRFQGLEQGFERRLEQTIQPYVRSNPPPTVQAQQATSLNISASTSRQVAPPAFTLFSDEDNNSTEWTDEIPGTINDFTAHMEPFLQSFIIRPLYRSGGEQIQTEAVRIAVLDTGFHGDDEDYFLLAAEPRIKLKQNFTGGGSDDCHDYHGHGTHVARLLLRFAPEADIYVAKISASRTLEKTRLDQIANALRWAGKHADIINLSFGLDQECPEATSGVDLRSEIDRLVAQKKLIFAAASNSGGNGSRPFPASHRGVFCIHATDDRGVANQRMNPIPLGDEENIATMGDKIESYWAGKRCCISGTSFATPIAAAIAANVLDFTRRHLARDDADMFARYGIMRTLFRNYMTDNGKVDGVYHYIKPWRRGLWERDAEAASIVEKLKEISIHCT